MTVNNSYNVLNSGYEKLRSMYSLNEENDLTKMLHSALENNENVTLIEDKVTISGRAEENQFGSDAWLDQILEELKKQEEANELNGVINKLYMGHDLSPAEMDMLREKAPQLYEMALEAKQMKKNLEEQLRNCKSKEEAERVKMNALQTVASSCGAKSPGSKIPESQAMKASILYAAVNKAFTEFTESEEYARLPKKSEEEKEKSQEKEKQKVNIYI